MISHFTFKPSPKLIFGVKKHLELSALLQGFGKKLLIIVGGRSFLSGEHWPILRQSFLDKGYSFSIEHIPGEPSPQAIDSIVANYAENTIDAVVAIGGGSVLDGGKAISAMLVEQNPVTEFLEGVGTQRPGGKKVPFIAVPTTSGTGSEATSNAVISSVGKDGFKKSLRHDNYIPDIALIDPVLTVGCPRDITVACGMDTFTQLVEAYLSTNSSPLTDALALDGIRCVIHSLEKVCTDGSDLSARTDLSYASYLSGVVLANAGLGVIHGFASAIGGLFQIPHGVVCGTLMAEANRVTLDHLRENEPGSAALVKYTELGRMAAGTQISDKEGQDFFINYIENLRKSFTIQALGHYGVSAADFDAIIQRSGNKYNPANLSENEHKSILLSCL